ncbi:MAG TPA: cupin domain-containing protein [Candidatus Wallbacteria bacterium]|nr:cupin domain-containing protein [Candidatus Wallbacteria bacterium]
MQKEHKCDCGNKECEARSLMLSENIEYQDGAVVSKTLINKRTGTVTLFAFDKGQSLSEHTAPFDAMVQILEGESEITVGGHPVSLKAGEFTIMPGGVPHSVNSITKFKMMLTMIKS